MINKIKRVRFTVLILALLTFSCSVDQPQNGQLRVGDGGIYLGGVFKINEVEDFKSLYPHNITEVVSHRIVNQVYEGLIKLSQKDLTITPSIAERWEISEDAKSFTFFLRKGVRFHDDPCFENGKGRVVTASDFKYCFDKLCVSDPNNQGFWVFKDRVIGADEHYQASLDNKPLPEGGVSGIEVIDNYTVKFNLKYSFPGFLNILTTPFTYVYPEEAFEKYGIDMRAKCVGTGPFKLKEVKEGSTVILSRNDNYWGFDEYGNKLPYLDAIKFTFVKEKKSEFLEFKKGNLDMVYELPIEMIDEILTELTKAQETNQDFAVQICPSLRIEYYGFQHESELFGNKLVRQAFNYAIDRERIVTYTLQGEGIPGTFGIVPPSFEEYGADNLRGYTYDPDKAKELLKKGGFPNGEGFPKINLQLNSGGTKNIQIAEVIQKMLKENLNVDIELEVLPWAQHLESIETGKALFWRLGWVADYPDPENFLNLLYSPHIPSNPNAKSYINSFRYRSAEFDSLFFLALRETDAQNRYILYRSSDQVALDDAAIMPIYYHENYRLVQNYVKNFDNNKMEYRDLSRVYFDGELLAAAATK